MTPEEQAREIRTGTKNPHTLYRGSAPLGFMLDPAEGKRIVSQSTLIGELVKALASHNKWHNDFTAVECIEDGKTFTLDLADAYSDSTLYEKTSAALHHARELGYE